MKYVALIPTLVALNSASVHAGGRCAAIKAKAAVDRAPIVESADFPPKNTKPFREFSRLLKAVDRQDLKEVRAIIKHGVSVNGRDAGDGFAPDKRPLARAAA